MVLEHNEHKVLENLIVSKLVSLAEVSQSNKLKKLKGHPITDSIKTKIVACEWESDILEKMIQKLDESNRGSSTLIK